MVYSTLKYFSVLDLHRHNSDRSDHSTAGSDFHNIKPSFTSTDSEFTIYAKKIYTRRKKKSQESNDNFSLQRSNILKGND